MRPFKRVVVSYGYCPISEKYVKFKESFTRPVLSPVNAKDLFFDPIKKYVRIRISRSLKNLQKKGFVFVLLFDEDKSEEPFDIKTVKRANRFDLQLPTLAARTSTCRNNYFAVKYETVEALFGAEIASQEYILVNDEQYMDIYNFQNK